MPSPERSTISWRFGWDVWAAGRTNILSIVFREAQTTKNDKKSITPRFTGGRVAISGQTCPPYIVKTTIANK
jgi:hypothetical protein